jgi:hypothetical protein
MRVSGAGMENVLRMYLEGTVHVRYIVKRYGMETSDRRLVLVAVDISFISSLELKLLS